MDGGVSVSLTSIARAWRQEGESFRVRFTPKGSYEPDAVAAALRAAVIAANEQSWERSNGAPDIGGGTIAGTPNGAIAFIDFCDTPQALRWFLETVGKDLESQGYAGRLGPAPEAIAPLDMAMAPVDVLAAGMTVPIEWDAVAAAHDRYPAVPTGWYVDESTTDRVLEVLTDWALAGPGNVYLRQGVPQIEVRPEDVLGLLASGVHREFMHSLTRAESDQQVRTVKVDILGRFILQEISPRSWLDRVADITEPLIALAPQIEVGLVRNAKAHGDWTQLVNRFDPVMPGGARCGTSNMRIRHLEASRTMDAYGIQILNDTHLSHTADLNRWEVTNVAPGRHLVRARDLAPWFETNPPSSAVLERARADFGDAILREHHYLAEPPRWLSTRWKRDDGSAEPPRGA